MKSKLQMKEYIIKENKIIFTIMSTAPVKDIFRNTNTIIGRTTKTVLV